MSLFGVHLFTNVALPIDHILGLKIQVFPMNASTFVHLVCGLPDIGLSQLTYCWKACSANFITLLSLRFDSFDEKS